MHKSFDYKLIQSRGNDQNIYDKCLAQNESPERKAIKFSRKSPPTQSVVYINETVVCVCVCECECVCVIKKYAETIVAGIS